MIPTPRIYLLEELVIDDSFARYCLMRSPGDVLFWTAYLERYPGEQATLKEAKDMVLALRQALLEQHGAGGELPAANRAQAAVRPLRRFFRYTMAAAAVIGLLTGLWYITGTYNRYKVPVQARSVPPVQQYSTGPGEKKRIRLPDSTLVYINAGSSLRLEEGFGRTNRSVYLSGEALFDVTHRPQQPFVVHLGSYDVKVLGTLFNVRAYPGDPTSETALLRGKVQILKKDGGDLTLVPNQKVIFKSIQAAANRPHKDRRDSSGWTIQKIVPLSVSPRDGSVVETAWSHNRLEVVNEPFSSLKAKLERWYHIEIVFVDQQVAEYRFTATFEKENITEALKALQYAYPFTYEFRDGVLRISQ